MDKTWLLKIGEYEKKIYSQAGQDGVLEYIFSNLEVRKDNSIPFCIEFGFNANTLTGGTGSNVANLVLNHGWNCLLMDLNYENIDINLHKHFLTSDNICEIFKLYNVPKSPEYISIDVDSTDLWLFRSILEEYSPMVVSVEYNSHFPIDRAITLRKDFCKFGKKSRRRIYGASLKALVMVGEQFGYTLVYVVRALDAFFIRNDLIENCDILSLESFREKTFINCHGIQKGRKRIKYFIDYEVYLKTDGDIRASKEAAQSICEECILQICQ